MSLTPDVRKSLARKFGAEYADAAVETVAAVREMNPLVWQFFERASSSSGRLPPSGRPGPFGGGGRGGGGPGGGKPGPGGGGGTGTGGGGSSGCGDCGVEYDCVGLGGDATCRETVKECDGDDCVVVSFASVDDYLCGRDCGTSETEPADPGPGRL